jgi:hypothetical protein
MGFVIGPPCLGPQVGYGHLIMGFKQKYGKEAARDIF